MQMQRLVPMPIGKPAETYIGPAADHPNILFVGQGMMEKIAKGAVTGFFLLMTLVMSIIAVVNSMLCAATASALIEIDGNLAEEDRAPALSTRRLVSLLKRRSSSMMRWHTVMLSARN